MEVIPGEDEGAAGVSSAAKDGLTLAADASLVVFDTGGGSTQITFGHGTQVDERFSVRRRGRCGITERFGLDRAVELRGARRCRRRRHLCRARPARPTARRRTPWSGWAAAVTNLAAVIHRLARYDPEVVQGSDAHPRRASIARSSCTGHAMPRRVGRSSASSRSGRRSSWPGRASSGRSWIGSGVPSADRQRPRACVTVCLRSGSATMRDGSQSAARSRRASRGRTTVSAKRDDRASDTPVATRTWPRLDGA